MLLQSVQLDLLSLEICDSFDVGQHKLFLFYCCVDFLEWIIAALVYYWCLGDLENFQICVCA